jgi:hypothetical protein
LKKFVSSQTSSKKIIFFRRHTLDSSDSNKNKNDRVPYDPDRLLTPLDRQQIAEANRMAALEKNNPDFSKRVKLKEPTPPFRESITNISNIVSNKMQNLNIIAEINSMKIKQSGVDFANTIKQFIPEGPFQREILKKIALTTELAVTVNQVS